jgi:hypothetical protein
MQGVELQLQVGLCDVVGAPEKSFSLIHRQLQRPTPCRQVFEAREHLTPERCQFIVQGRAGGSVVKRGAQMVLQVLTRAW